MSRADAEMVLVPRAVLGQAEQYVECLHSIALTDEGRNALWANLTALRRALAEPARAGEVADFAGADRLKC